MSFNESRAQNCALYALAGLTGFVCGAYFQQEASIRHLFSAIKRDPHIYHFRHKLYPMFSTFPTDHETRLWQQPHSLSDRIRECLVSPLFDLFSAMFMLKNETPNTIDLLDLIKYGLPSSENLCVHKDYIVSQNFALNRPNWVCEHLRGNYKKLSTDDDGDESLHLRFNDVYVLSSASTRICKAFKRKIWRELEQYVSTLTEQYGSVYAYTGPVYTPSCRDHEWSMEYEVLDWRPYPVPSHYFKVLIIESQVEGCAPYMECFMIENSNKLCDNLSSSLAQVEEIERFTGLRFNKGLRPTVVYSDDTCTVDAKQPSRSFAGLSEPLMQTIFRGGIFF
ncbi:endonuclease G, mitochondrial [Drosophila tropicalis]|uniref:endonuclease G, mitochondrial n=1 Tax=Drosophila tropicalis TaxID=46794 RepID=UPI0035ABA4D7